MIAEAKLEIERAIVKIANEHNLLPTQTLEILGDLLHVFLDQLDEETKTAWARAKASE